MTVLEEDTYGRVLFGYSKTGLAINGVEGSYSALICQKAGSEYAYYYPDYNFVVRQRQDEITEADIAKLKEDNDWEKPLDDSKMTRVRIVTHKKLDNSLSRTIERTVFAELVNFESEFVSVTSLGQDKDNRWLFYARIDERKGDRHFKWAYMLVLNEDFTFTGPYIEEIEDIWNYQDQLKDFKARNNWVLYAE